MEGRSSIQGYAHQDSNTLCSFRIDPQTGRLGTGPGNGRGADARLRRLPRLTGARPPWLVHILDGFDRLEDPGLAEGFFQEDMGAEILGDPKAGVPRDMAAARHRYDLHGRMLLADLRDEFEPVALGHQQVGDHNLHGMRRQDLGRLEPVLRGDDGVSCSLEHHAEQLPYARFIINDKYRAGRH